MKKRISLIIVAAALILSGIFAPTLEAQDAYAAASQDQYDRLDELAEAIKKKNEEIAALQAKVAEFSAQAASYQNQVDKLRFEESQLQAEIDKSTLEYNRLQAEITIKEKKIADTEEAIGNILVDMYFAKDTTLLEKLASSKSLTSFIDDSAKMSASNYSLSVSASSIKEAKASLEADREKVEQVLNRLNDQKKVLSDKRAEVQALLNYTASQKANYTKEKQAAERERSKLQDEQRRLNLAIAAANNASGQNPGDPNKGYYPYAKDCPKKQDWYADAWRLYVCECVSYVAWRVDNAYGNMPVGGMGNANQWLGNAKKKGIPTGTTAKVGSVGVWNSGAYGHVVWVEIVNGNRLYVSQYNYVRGDYSEMWIDKSAFDGFIYFDQWKR